MEDAVADQLVAFVTGVSSGIGEATARTLARDGYRVFGTVRSPDAVVPDGVERVSLDVCDEATVSAGVASVLSRAGRIDALVNNAGATIVGAIEETDTAQAQALFDVNFFGAARVTRAVLPIMRAQRKGRVVFVSSVPGFLPAPFMGFYAASKHALEGYSESLDHEVRALGIRSILVEPGYMKTKLDKNAKTAGATIDDYLEARERVGAYVNARIESGEDPARVAGVIAAALEARRPKLRYPVGKGTGTLATLRSFMPASLFDRSFRKEFRLDGAR
jgi:NAD(P)-dependent dehydrogenase (short-subunit alcohol dehydrogenase family)